MDYLDKRAMDNFKFFLLSPMQHFYNSPVWAYIASDNKRIVNIFQLLYVSKRKIETQYFIETKRISW